MFDGEPQAGAVAAQVEVGVAPGVQLGGAAQGLAGAEVGGALAGMVDEEHGAGEVPLELAQGGEHGGDLGGHVLVDAMQAHEGVEHEERGAQGRRRWRAGAA